MPRDLNYILKPNKDEEAEASSTYAKWACCLHRGRILLLFTFSSMWDLGRRTLVFCWPQRSSLCRSHRPTGYCNRETELGRHSKWCCGHQNLQGKEEMQESGHASNDLPSPWLVDWEQRHRCFLISKKNLTTTTHLFHLLLPVSI